jgi:hypothetical protein
VTATTTRTARQLALIGEVVAITADVRIQVWLRGGWAMDFFLGEVTREHDDIDFFAWALDGPALAAELPRHGFRPVPGPPPAKQLDFTRHGEDLQFALLARDATGRPADAGGPWAGEPFPEAAPDPEPGRLGELTCPVVNPAGQIEIKRMMPQWNPRLRRRPKDAADIARLRAALARSGDPGSQ